MDVVTREVFDGELTVDNGRITRVRRCPLPPGAKEWPYLMPGFIDSHVHIESSMMTPCEFAHIASSHGTIGVVADPHEIANVMGVEGVDYMIRSGRDATFNFCFAAPSCVPCCTPDIETSGAVIDAAAIEQLMAREEIGALGEMMNFPGALRNDPEVMRKIRAAQKHGKPVDGHAPGLTGTDRECYAQAGISTDHECVTIQEGRACIAAGMKVIIRDGSAAKDFDSLYPLIREAPDMVMFCSDDCHPDDLVRGHINLMVRRALQEGYGLWDVLTAASVNPQRNYHLDWGLLREGDAANFIAVDVLNPHFRVLQTVIRGIEVFDCNATFGAVRHHLPHMDASHPLFPNRFEAGPVTQEDISLDVSKRESLHVMCAADGSLYTRHDTVNISTSPFDGHRYPWGEVQKTVVINRYRPDARPVVGLVRGFGLSQGAIAASVAHDCHNIVAVGSDDEYLVKALNRVIEMRGGLAAVAGDDMADLALPIAGLMSPLSGHEVAYRSMLLSETARRAGCRMRAPFITMSFLCLPVIPELKITDKHLWDSKHMRIVE